jgi:hypothetical protein
MTTRKELQSEWLELWRLAGSPQLDIDTWDTPDAPLKLKAIVSWGSNLGTEDYINIHFGEHDVTSLFALLAGYKGRGCILYRQYDRDTSCEVDTVMRRRDYFRKSESMQRVASQVIELHAAAAKKHLDVAAYRATGLPADELEARLLARATKPSRRQQQPKAL